LVELRMTCPKSNTDNYIFYNFLLQFLQLFFAIFLQFLQLSGAIQNVAILNCTRMNVIIHLSHRIINVNIHFVLQVKYSIMILLKAFI